MSETQSPSPGAQATEPIAAAEPAASPALLNEQVASLVRRYRLAAFQKKQVEATLDALRSELKPLIESQGEFADEHGFARIVPGGGNEPVPFISSDNTRVLVVLVRQWLASTEAALVEAGRITTDLIEMKEPKKPYLLVK